MMSGAESRVSAHEASELGKGDCALSYIACDGQQSTKIHYYHASLAFILNETAEELAIYLQRPSPWSPIPEIFRDLVTIMASSSYFYLVPAFTLQVTQQIDLGWITLPNSAPNTIYVGAHVVFSNVSHPPKTSHYPPMISGDGATYFVRYCEQAVVCGSPIFRIRVASSHGAAHIYSSHGETFPAGTTATFAVHSQVSECQSSKAAFDASIKLFEDGILHSLNLQSSHQTFEQSFLQNGKKCWRALAKVSPKSGSFDFSAKWRKLRKAGHVLLYPAHQFAMQALMGISSSHTLNLKHGCGAAFLDTMEGELWQPFDSLEEYCKRTIFSNIRNIFAHSFEGSSSGALSAAAKDWCFHGTRMATPAQTAASSSFWAMSDVLSYAFTATSLSFFLPLCYQAVCTKLSARRKACEIVCCECCYSAKTDKGLFWVSDLPPNSCGDDWMVTFNQDFGLLKQGIAYHVIDMQSKPPANGETETSFSVGLRKGKAIESIVTIALTSGPQAASAFPSGSVSVTFRKQPDYLLEDAILSCMPSDQAAREVPSLLDSYFNYSKPLAELMAQLEGGDCDEHLFDPVCAGNIKKHQYSADEGVGSHFCQRFAVLRKAFNDKIFHLFQRYHTKMQEPHSTGGRVAYRHVSLWQHDVAFSIDSSVVAGSDMPHKVFLGISHVGKFKHPHVEVRIPRAIKMQEPARQHELFTLMDTLKTGSNIASASKHRCLEIKDIDAFSPQAASDVLRSKDLPEESEMWHSEAGICTLKELFESGVCLGERQTLAFRNLMRQVSTGTVDMIL